jgi:3'-phosphoadenosine 5'-phosphosulfate sulfotransferase (PAPS reductase)/FAD synthetase
LDRGDYRKWIRAILNPEYIVFASYGNDSIALIQFCYELGLTGVVVIYSDTGWAADWWKDRVNGGEAFVKRIGYTPVRTVSIGMEQLIQNHKGWPRQGIQFCTEELKIQPAKAKLAELDPDKKATCLAGVRRAESANRRSFPEFTDSSPSHDGRRLWAPLVDHTDEQRNELIASAGFDILPHRSMECFPCINSNRADLRELAKHPERIEHINSLEILMGFTSKNKPRTMFRPYRYMGATGIKEIVRWAISERGEFDPDDGTGGGNCDSGYCGA